MNIGFVPARCGSKSIPFKNIKTFCGKPLIFWVLNSLQQSSKIDKFYLASDCDEIFKVATSFNFSKLKIYRRNAENAADHSSTEDVILEFIDNNEIEINDTFILIQATSPFVTNKDIDMSLEKYNSDKCDSLLSCVRTKRFFWNENGVPINYNYKSRPRRQDFEGTLTENGAIYINSVKNIYKYKNRICGKISIYEMPHYTFLELDEEDDWNEAETLMKKYNSFFKSNKNKITHFFSDVDGTLTDAGMYYDNDNQELKNLILMMVWDSKF